MAGSASGTGNWRRLLGAWGSGTRGILLLLLAAVAGLGLAIAADPPPPNTPTVAALDKNNITVKEGASGVVTATLSPVPNRAGVLALTTSNPDIASVPATLGYAAGQATVGIPVTGESEGGASITASLNGSSRGFSVNVVSTPSRLVAVAPAQAVIREGASGQFTLQLTPRRPNQSRIVQLVSSDPSKVTVPATVTVAAGQPSVVFTATAVGEGRARITARLDNNGVATSSAAEVLVLPSLTTVVSLLPPTNMVEKGAQVQLKVGISRAQSTTTTVALAASVPGVLAVPSQVQVPAGQSEASFTVTGTEVGNAFVVATLNGSQVQAAVQVMPVPTRIASLEPSTAQVVVSAQAQITAKLTSAATTPTTIAVTTEPPGVIQVPAQVQVAAGATEVNIAVTGLAVGEADVVAQLNGTIKRSRVTVTPQPAQLVGLVPATLGIQRGASGLLVARLNAVQTEPVTVTLASSQPTIVRVPDNVTIPAGALEQSISIGGLEEGTSQVSATLNGTTVTSVVTVTLPPPQIAGVEPTSQDLPKGKLGKVKLLLDRAPQEPALLAITNDNTAAVQVAAQVTVPAGQTFVEVPVVAQELGRANLTAALNGSTASTAINVVEPEIVAITVTPSSAAVAPGQSAQMQATGTYSDASTRDITTGAGTAWSTGSTTIATVDQTGKVTGEQPGDTSVSALQSVLPTYGNPNPSAVIGTASVTVSAASALAVSAGKSSLVVGESTNIIVTTPYPVASTPVVVTLTVSGTGGMQVPATLTIGPGLTSVSGVITATAAGSPAVQVSAPKFASSQLTFTVVPPAPVGVVISGISPTSGAPGSEVVISGSGFVSPATSNTVAFYGNVPAVVLSGSATQLTVKVPDAAQSGPITVSNSIGLAQSGVFTVVREQDFGIQASPAFLKVMQDSNAAVVLNLSTTGTRAYQGLARLSATGMPTGVLASFEPSNLSAYQTGKLVLKAEASAALGTATITVRAEATLDGLPWVRESRINVEVIPKGNVTGVKGRFITPEGAGIAGVIVRQDTSTNQVVSDAAGNFLITGLAAGVTTLRFDATPANSLYPIWPYNVTLEAGQLLTANDWVINPPPSDDKFKQIANATQDQAITDDRFPGFSIVLPAGATITGWDGVKKTRIAVERISPDRLPVGSPPFPMKEAFQLYFGTPMGGIPSTPIPVTLPNVAEKEPGEQVEIWWFDGSPMGGTGDWKMAGMGTVSPDGKTVSSNAGVGIPRFCGVCGLVSLSCPPPPNPPPPSCPPKTAGNPVDLFNGQEMPSSSGMTCGGITPIDTGMQYNPVDSFGGRAGTIASFGFGWTFDYDVSFLPFEGVQKRLVMPGGAFINMVNDGTGKYRPVGSRMGGAYAQDATGGRWEVVQPGGVKWLFEPFPGIPGVIRGGPPLFLTRITDRNGNSTVITRQANGRIQSVAGAGGRSVNMSYGSNGFVSRITDHTGRTQLYEYTGANRVSKVTDALNRVTEYGYQNLPVFANTYSSCVARDSAGNCTQSTSTSVTACEAEVPQGHIGITSIKYPESDVPTVNTYGTDRILRQTTSTGQEWKFSYRRGGACVVKVLDTPRVTSNSTETFAFTCKAGQSLTTRSCSGGQCTDQVVGTCPEIDSEESRAAGWRFYGGTNTETRITLPNGHTRIARFDAGGKVSEEVDELGQTTRNFYDANQRLARTVYPLGRERKYEYDSAGNRIATIDALGRRSESAFDPVLSKPTSKTQFLLGVPSTQGSQQLSYTPVIHSTAYDGKGNAIAFLDPSGITTQLGYDTRGQISQVNLAVRSNAAMVPIVSNGVPSAVARDARKLTFGYNAAGDLTTVTDAQGQETRYDRDSLGRMTVITDPLGYSSQVQYHALDQPTLFTDALQQSTTLGYDTAGRLTGVTNPANATVQSYGYDANGRINRITDALGQSSTRDYDASARPVKVTDRRGQVTTMGYDARGEITEINTPGRSLRLQYDAAGRLVEVRDGSSVNSYLYDAADRIVQTDSTTAAGRHRLQYDYDSLDRITRRTLSGTGIVAVEETTYEWDLAGRLVSHTTRIAGQPHKTSYEYDVAGRLAARKVQVGDQTDLITQRYGYDLVERLAQIKYIKAEGTAGEQLIEQVDYSYDANSRRIAKTALNNGGMGGQETPMTATYDAANRMTGITLTAATGAKTYTLTYDGNGNPTQKANTQDSSDKTIYTWDAANRLVGITQPQLNASFTYDAFGRRVQATLTRAGQAPQTVQYIYEGSQQLGEIRDGNLTHRLLTGLALDETIARIAISPAGQKDSVASRIMLTDALNSVLAQVSDDGTATIQNSYGYSPYGETIAIGPDATGNSAQYTSRENDGTGLYFYRARYYDPVLKRFISEDPIALAGGLNLFAYVGGDPLSRVDPTGEYWVYVWRIVAWVGKRAIYALVREWVEDQIRPPPPTPTCVGSFCGGGGDFGGGGASGGWGCDDCDERKTLAFQNCVEKGTNMYVCLNQVKDMCEAP